MLKIKATAYGNPDRGQDPTQEIANIELQAETIKKLRIKVREWQEFENLGGGNWGDCPIYLNDKLVGYMSYNGRVWKEKIKSMAGIEINDASLC